MTSLNNETAPEGTEVVRLVAEPTKQLGHGEGVNLPTTVFVDAVLTQAGKI